MVSKFGTAALSSGVTAVLMILAALAIPFFDIAIPSDLTFLASSVGSQVELLKSSTSSVNPLPGLHNFTCSSEHTYHTTIVAIDPLVIYIHSFLSPAEISHLLALSDDPQAGKNGPAVTFRASQVNHANRNAPHVYQSRTSSSAGLPVDDPAVDCILQRAADFLGTMIDNGPLGEDEIGSPQLVRYAPGQKFDVHHDWFDAPGQPSSVLGPPKGDKNRRRKGRLWNRVASFFAVLEDDCQDGETWFPYVDLPGLPKNDKAKASAADSPSAGDETRSPRTWTDKDPLWRAHENGGTAFRPIAGNALFWVNLFNNGTGDRRVMHSGLPTGEGRKTAMNIWPRKFFN